MTELGDAQSAESADVRGQTIRLALLANDRGERCWCDGDTVCLMHEQSEAALEALDRLLEERDQAREALNEAAIWLSSPDVVPPRHLDALAAARATIRATRKALGVGS